MYASVKIDYRDREIWVDYDYDKAEDDVNLGHRARLLKAEFNGRDITRWVNRSDAEDEILEQHHNTI